MADPIDWEAECKALHQICRQLQDEKAAAQAEAKLLAAQIEQAQSALHAANAERLAGEAELVMAQVKAAQLEALLGDTQAARLAVEHWRALLGIFNASTDREN